jgi:hypothetical protein
MRFQAGKARMAGRGVDKVSDRNVKAIQRVQERFAHVREQDV